MQNRIATLLAVGLLAGCATRSADAPGAPGQGPSSHLGAVDTLPDATSTAATVDGYKRDLAHRISHVNSRKVFTGRPQALLRSVVVVRYTVDSGGRLLRSEIMRSNRDRETETTALASLRSAAPFPKPASHLLQHGKLDLAETWLFNNDGRFQLRTIAEAQMDQ